MPCLTRMETLPVSDFFCGPEPCESFPWAQFNPYDASAAPFSPHASVYSDLVYEDPKSWSQHTREKLYLNLHFPSTWLEVTLRSQPFTDAVDSSDNQGNGSCQLMALEIAGQLSRCLRMCMPTLTHTRVCRRVCICLVQGYSHRESSGQHFIASSMSSSGSHLTFPVALEGSGAFLCQSVQRSSQRA